MICQKPKLIPYGIYIATQGILYCRDIPTFQELVFIPKIATTKTQLIQQITSTTIYIANSM